jgi:hypothetical protein
VTLDADFGGLKIRVSVGSIPPLATIQVGSRRRFRQFPYCFIVARLSNDSRAQAGPTLAD